MPLPQTRLEPGVSCGWEEPTPQRSRAGSLGIPSCPAPRHGRRLVLKPPERSPGPVGVTQPHHPRRGSTARNHCSHHAATSGIWRCGEVPPPPLAAVLRFLPPPHRNHSGWTATQAAAPAPQTASVYWQRKTQKFFVAPAGRDRRGPAGCSPHCSPAAGPGG